VGNSPSLLLVVGQAVYGWIPDWTPDELSVPSARARILEDTQSACYDLEDPMGWIREHPVRSSPFWRMVRRTSELLWGASTDPWYSHVAWTNLYPIAPNDPKGNPSGVLLDVQTAPAAHLLRAVFDELRPQAVVVAGGPYWWAFQQRIPLRILERNERPLLAEGIIDSVPWIAGMHPAGAQRRRWKPDTYASLVVDRIAALAHRR
jgi:hypothetical protein